jgi:hypothetical protein
MIALGGLAAVDAFFSPRNPADSYIEISGEMLIGGTALRSVRLRLGAHGLVAQGAFVTPYPRST